MALKFDLVEMREQQAREQLDRALAVIAEFGGRKPERMLVPEDDPALAMRLVNEILCLRDQIRRIGKAVESRTSGQAVSLIPHGPHGQPDDK